MSARDGLRLDPVHGLDELSPAVRCRVREDDQPQPVTLSPEDILPIGSVRLGRIEQGAVECLLRNTCVEHLRLGMTAHGDVPEVRYIFVVVLHAGLSSDYSSAVAGPVRTRCTLMRLIPRALAMALGPCPSSRIALTFATGT